MGNFPAFPDNEASDAHGGHEPFAPRVFALEGRIGRLRYLLVSLVPAIVLWVLLLLIYGIAATRFDFFEILDAHPPYVLPLLAIHFVIMRRRLNDVDRSGWFGLLMLVPFVNFPFSLYLLFAAGTPGENRYGLAPAPNPPYLLGYCLSAPVLLVFVMLKIAHG